MASANVPSLSSSCRKHSRIMMSKYSSLQQHVCDKDKYGHDEVDQLVSSWSQNPELSYDSL